MWLGLPFESPCPELARLSGDVLEERAADAAADPVGLDPEILEPPDQAAGDQRRPADWISPALSQKRGRV